MEVSAFEWSSPHMVMQMWVSEFLFSFFLLPRLLFVHCHSGINYGGLLFAGKLISCEKNYACSMTVFSCFPLHYLVSQFGSFIFVNILSFFFSPENWIFFTVVGCSSNFRLSHSCGRQASGSSSSSSSSSNAIVRSTKLAGAFRRRHVHFCGFEGMTDYSKMSWGLTNSANSGTVQDIPLQGMIPKVDTFLPG